MPISSVLVTSTVNELVDTPSTQEFTWRDAFWLSRSHAPIVILTCPYSRAPMERGQPDSQVLHDWVKLSVS